MINQIFDFIMDTLLPYIGLILIITVALFIAFLLGCLIHSGLYGYHPEPYIDIIEKVVDGKTIRNKQIRYREHCRGLFQIDCDQCNDPDLKDVNEYRPPVQHHAVYGVGTGMGLCHKGN